VIQNDVFIANPVQRKMQIHACLEELICLVEREQQFVVLRAMGQTQQVLMPLSLPSRLPRATQVSTVVSSFNTKQR
jgi:hypothetical protein